MPAKEYAVEVTATIKRRNRMVYTMEVSIPAKDLKTAEKIRQPFVDELIKAMRGHRRRSSRPRELR